MVAASPTRLPLRRFAGAVRWALLVGGLALVAYSCAALPFSLHRMGVRLQDADLAARFLSAVALGFMWAYALGAFGWGKFERADAVLIIPTVLAIAIRLFLVRHSNSAITTYFPDGDFAHDQGPFTDKHSVVYAGLKAFLSAQFGLTQERLMNLNGVVGALAAPAAGLFTTRRFAARAVGFCTALLLAVHPILARMAPTDAQLSLLLFWWFAGLAMLSSDRIRPLEALSGFLCLGIAGTMRVEAPLYIALTLVAVRWPALAKLLRDERSGRLAIVAGVLGACCLVGANFAGVSSHWHDETARTTAIGLLDWHELAKRMKPIFASLFVPGGVNDAVFLAFFWLGIVAAIASARFRVVALLAAASCAAVFICQVDPMNGITLHRLTAPVALQVLVGGVGAGWLISLARPVAVRWVVSGAMMLAAGTIPFRHEAEMKKAYAFNTEYELLHEHWPSESSTSTLLCFDPGDGDLNTVFNIVRGVNTINCADTDCVDAVRHGGHYILLRGSGCYDNRSAAKCATLMDAFETRALAEAPADFDEEFRFPERIPPRGIVGLYEVVGPSHRNADTRTVSTTRMRGRAGLQGP